MRAITYTNGWVKTLIANANLIPPSPTGCHSLHLFSQKTNHSYRKHRYTYSFPPKQQSCIVNTITRTPYAQTRHPHHKQYRSRPLLSQITITPTHSTQTKPKKSPTSQIPQVPHDFNCRTSSFAINRQIPYNPFLSNGESAHPHTHSVWSVLESLFLKKNLSGKKEVQYIW